jgi:hypothetical protein
VVAATGIATTDGREVLGLAVRGRRRGDVMAGAPDRPEDPRPVRRSDRDLRPAGRYGRADVHGCPKAHSVKLWSNTPSSRSTRSVTWSGSWLTTTTNAGHDRRYVFETSKAFLAHHRDAERAAITDGP